MTFTAKDVAALRESTGAGMMDCKRALQENGGDMEKAVFYLREKGLAAAAKKASRIAAEGLVYADVQNGVGVVLEINSETDFAAKSDPFVAFIREMAGILCQNKPADLAALLETKTGGGTVADALREKVLVIGENLQIRRFAVYPENISIAYVHMGGRIGVLLNLTAEGIDAGAVQEMGKNIAMQIAAMRPIWLDSADADSETVEREKAVFMAQILEEGKPQHVAEKIVAGRINKYFQEVCLLQQPYVKENKMTVAEYVQSVAKELGGTIKLNAFTRFEKGEGLEKREDNFADEVSKMTQ